MEQHDEQHPAHLIDALGRDERLDPAAERLEELADRVAGGPESPRSRVLRGEWLGHPLHPMLTDLPVGFWTSAFVLDLVGGRRMSRAARMLVGAGLLSAVPTAATGMVDLRDRKEQADRRVGVAHAAANGVATLLYARSFWHRVRGRRLRGVATGLLGAAAATAGGYLGGHLAFGTDDRPAGDASAADRDTPGEPTSMASSGEPGLDVTDTALETADRATEAGIVDQQGAALSMSAGT